MKKDCFDCGNQGHFAGANMCKKKKKKGVERFSKDSSSKKDPKKKRKMRKLNEEKPRKVDASYDNELDASD